MTVMTRLMQLFAITMLLLITAGLSAAAQKTDSLQLHVEPRLVPVNGVIRIYVVSIPKGYTAVVARLEGPITTGYVTLTPGSVAAIDLSLYNAKPGLYYVAVYNAPGGRLLAKIPVLVVKPLILVTPPRPTVGEKFTVTVAVQPAGYDYSLTLHIDGRTYTLRPGQSVTLQLNKRGPYKLCLDIEAIVEGAKFYTPNVTCKTLTLNLPPSVSFDLRVTGNYLVLITDSVDPDGIVTSVKYTCMIDNETYTGYVSPGFARTVLTTIDVLKRLYSEGYRSIRCTVEAVDDAGGVTIKTKNFNMTALFGVIPPKQSKTESKGGQGAAPQAATTRRVPATPTPAAPTTAQPRLPLQGRILLILAVGGVAAAVGGVSIVMLKRKHRKPAAAKAAEAITAETTSSVDLTSIIVRLDRIEQRLDELHARVGELQGEVDELRRRVRRLERSGERQGR